MAKYSTPLVAISSTVTDLDAHRSAAIDACRRVGARVLTPEDTTIESPRGVDEWLDRINEADIYVGIVGFRYGYIPRGRNKSVLDLEYERAGQLGIPRLMFFMSDQHAIQAKDVEIGAGATKLARFKEDVSRTALISFFSSPDELKLKILESLSRYQAESYAPKRALLLIPVSPTYEQLRAQLSSLLEGVGFVVLRLDQLQPGAVWSNAVADAIRSADLIIADVTEANPNVMYELGYAHALKRPTLLLANATTRFARLPSDVQSFQVLMYDDTSEAAWQTHLARVIRAYLGGAV